MQIPSAARYPGRSLQTYLVALVSSALIPAIAVGAIAVGSALDSYRRVFDDRLSSTARVLASAVKTEIDAHILAVATLATDRAFDPGQDVASVQSRVRQVAAAFDTRIFVVAPDLSLVLHAPAAPEANSAGPLAQDAADAARQAFESLRPAIGHVLRMPDTGRMVVPAYVPVLRDGRVVYAIGIAVEAERLSRLLSGQDFHDGGYASVVDAHGRILARSTDTDRYIGQRVRDWVMEGTSSTDAGMLHGRNRAGLDIVTAFHQVGSAPGWFVAVAVPLSAYRASLWNPLLAIVFGGLASLAIALWMAMDIGRRIMQPVAWLTRKAERVVATGGAAEIMPDPVPVKVQEFVRLRDAVLQAHMALRDRAADIAAGEARLRAIVDTAVDAIVVIDETGIIQSFNPAAEAIFGYEAAEVVGRNIKLLMPAGYAAGHDGFLAAYRQSGARRIIGIGREVEARRKDGSLVPIDLAIAEWRDAGGKRFFTGIMRDISARRADDQRRLLLMREVDHRAKNTLAVVQSVLRLTPRDEAKAFATAVEARVAALARVHSLLAEGGWSGADLRALVEQEMAPYAAPKGGSSVSIDGPPLALAQPAVQPVAMVIHELATNAAKHGALSLPGGMVRIGWCVDRGTGGAGQLHLRWMELGGPPILGVPTRRGFGTRVIEATVRSQLGGTIGRRWSPDGLIVELSMPLPRVLAAHAAAVARASSAPNAA